MFFPAKERLESAPADWKQELAESLRTASDLHANGFIEASEIPAYEELLKTYQFLLPRYYASLIDREDPHCPIRRQAIPELKERDDSPLRWADPLSDLSNQPERRVTHRYRDRALLHLTAACSMYCRFCFRKSLLNELKSEFIGGEIEKALDYFRTHTEISEVIFSGGDPFLASFQTLIYVLRELKKLSHIERLRFHTRVPVTFPARVELEFTRALAENIGVPWTVVCHFNHPREVTVESRRATNCLREAGAQLLNQSVLLRGVNDRAETLIDLSKKLFSAGILPYYLHHPDPAKGTIHFEMDHAEGLAMWNAMKRSLPGYLVPRYVFDDPRQPFKTEIATL